MPDGRVVAVKVQYPGVDKAIKSDLDNAELLYGLFASFALKNLDVKALVDELRARMGDELDYRLEAACQTEFAERYRRPPVHPRPRRRPRALQPAGAHQRVGRRACVGRVPEPPPPTRPKQQAAEVLFRFAQGSIHRHGVFNGDPHPGNYRFHHDGTVTFLDFGLVKRWAPGELERAQPVLDAILDRDAERHRRRRSSTPASCPPTTASTPSTSTST